VTSNTLELAKNWISWWILPSCWWS